MSSDKLEIPASRIACDGNMGQDVWICLAELKEVFDIELSEGHDNEWLACYYIPKARLRESKEYSSKDFAQDTREDNTATLNETFEDINKQMKSLRLLINECIVQSNEDRFHFNICSGYLAQQLGSIESKSSEACEQEHPEDDSLRGEYELVDQIPATDERKRMVKTNSEGWQTDVEDMEGTPSEFYDALSESSYL